MNVQASSNPDDGNFSAGASRPRDADDFVRMLSQHSTDLITLHDPAAVCIYASDVATTMLGYEPDELIGRSVYDFVHPDDRERLSENHQQVLERTDVVTATLRWRRKDGRDVWLESTSRATRDARRANVTEILTMSRDVTEWVQAQEGLREAEERFRTAFEQAPIGMALVSLDGRYLRVNHSLSRITEYSEQELLARTFHEITHPEDLSADLELNRRLLSGEANAFHLEKRYVTASGGVVWCRLSVSLFRNSAGEPVHFICQMEDVTARKEAEKRLMHQALHDPLTGLHNRTLFMDRLVHALARSERFMSPVAVLFVDLDHFKQVNDEYGHRVGDDMLVAVARKIESAVRPADTVARLGGDEFAVLCEDMKTEKDAVVVAQRLSAELQEPVRFDSITITMTASIGIAFAQEGDDPDSLLKNADAAMYKVKEGGRGSYEIFLDAL